MSSVVTPQQQQEETISCEVMAPAANMPAKLDNVNVSSSSERERDLSKCKSEPPVQPVLKEYPKKNSRRFTPELYKTYAWLEYSVQTDALFYFACRHFASTSLVAGEKSGARIFIDKGYSCWKNVRTRLCDHSESKRHRSAVVAWAYFKSVNAGQKTSIANAINVNRSAEKRRYGHYSSPHNQNDMIRVFGEKVKKIILEEVKDARFFAILVDETKDLSKKEQLAIIIRYVHDGCIKERALGTWHMKELSAEALATFLFKEIGSMGLDIQLCVGQCYDGASVMRGNVSGVQARIKDKVPHAVYIHCYAHRLNLVLVDTISDIPQMSEFFYLVQTLYSFIANSNTRHQLFIDAQTHLEQRVLQLERTCNTRWLYWYRAVQKIKLRFEAILAVLEATTEARADGSIEAAGLKLKIEAFPFLLHLTAMERILRITHGLSELLQERGLAIPKAATLIKSTKSLLEKMRSEGEWQTTLKSASAFAAKVGVDLPGPAEAIAHRPRPARARMVSTLLSSFVVDSTSGQRPQTQDNDKIVFYEVLDRFIFEFTRRFSDNEGLMHAIQAFDPSSSHFMDVDKMEEFACHYEMHINTDLLQAQCQSAQAFLKMGDEDDETGDSMLSPLAKLEAVSVAFPEVIKLFQIAATLPVSTASNERFFSVLKRVKDYLRTTMGDDRLSHLMLMAVEQRLVKSFNLDELVTDFARLRPRRFPLSD
ncbi:hypothetical protein SKAU_G00150450 [Synaphobranchus kaupii]|uniref:TTF-type domain-containing protein n=1 Tax=Synaphobranchus kaupii TaxID=118154 RepID=A0A9Q1FH31_SYNKA|nr:hypothetical protein SKAU_G00150450 [Synaphobranchus kaupii]